MTRFKRLTMLWTIGGLCLVLARPASAQVPEVVQRYIDKGTLAVGRVDLAKLDVEASVAFVEEMAADLPEWQRRRLLAQTRSSLSAVTQQAQPLLDAGATQGWFLLGAATFLAGEAPLVVVPTESEQQAQQVSAALDPMSGESRAVEGAVLLGDPGALEASATPRPVFAEAFEGEGVMEVVVVPTPLVRSLLGAYAAQGPGMTTQVRSEVSVAMQKLRWGRMSLNLPPDPEARLSLQFEDKAAAQQVAEATGMLLEWAKNQPGELPSRPAFFDALSPSVEQNTLRVTLETAELREAVGPALARGYLNAREAAARIRSGSNLRHFGQVIRRHAFDHEGAYPASLEELRTYALTQENWTPQVWEAFMTNPRYGIGNAYAYLGGGMTDEADSTQVLMYGKPATWEEEGVMALFADGSAEWKRVEELEALAREQGFEIERLEE